MSVGSMIFPNTWLGIVVTEFLFPRFGLTIGDCLTERALLGFEVAGFLVDFLGKSTELAGAE